MESIRYIHCADLHLDAPFKGIAREAARGSQLSRALKESTFTALNRLIKLCQAEKPDFLVVAGDVFNQEERSVKALLEFRDACGKLGEIPAFIACGNHDPLRAWPASVKWPQNVHIFGVEPAAFPVERNGRQIALVHGASYGRESESRNLARLFKRAPKMDCFQLGVLHCALAGSQADADYAPCAVEDLAASGLDAWALGHAHERKIVRERPFIAYPGSSQGLSAAETGPKGCWLVEASRDGSGWKCEASFKSLNSIQWEKLQVDLETVDRVEEVDDRLRKALDALRKESSPLVEGFLVRICLSGSTPLSSWLKKESSQQELFERLVHYSGENPPVWIKDIKVETRWGAALDDYLKRDDLAGEAARLAASFLEDENSLDEFVKDALAPAYSSSQFRKGLPEISREEARELLLLARDICQEALEAR